IPAKQRSQSVGCCEVNTSLPFFGGYKVANRCGFCLHLNSPICCLGYFQRSVDQNREREISRMSRIIKGRKSKLNCRSTFDKVTKITRTLTRSQRGKCNDQYVGFRAHRRANTW